MAAHRHAGAFLRPAARPERLRCTGACQPASWRAGTSVQLFAASASRRPRPDPANMRSDRPAWRANPWIICSLPDSPLTISPLKPDLGPTGRGSLRTLRKSFPGAGRCSPWFRGAEKAETQSRSRCADEDVRVVRSARPLAPTWSERLPATSSPSDAGGARCGWVPAGRVRWKKLANLRIQVAEFAHLPVAQAESRIVSEPLRVAPPVELFSWSSKTHLTMQTHHQPARPPQPWNAI